MRRGSEWVDAFFHGQDGLDGDAVGHFELAREAGLVGVQGERGFLAGNDQFDRLLVALGAIDGGVEEGGNGIAGGRPCARFPGRP